MDMSNTTKTTDAVDPIDRPCEECGALPGEPCRPYCTAEPPVWMTFDRATYRLAGPTVTAPNGDVQLPRWCLMARKAIGPWVWYLIDRSQHGDDGYALVTASGEARTLKKARAAAEAALSTATA